MLIGIMFVGSSFAAGDPAAFDTPENFDEQLQKTQQRAINATTFQTMSAQSVFAENDEVRDVLNSNLIQLFEQMETELGASPLLTLHNIGTECEATEACTYYTDAKNALLALMRNVTEQNEASAQDE